MKRYATIPTNGSVREVESDTGRYVLYEDAAELEEKLEEITAVLEALNLNVPARMAD